jgi:hypothetical protein
MAPPNRDRVRELLRQGATPGVAIDTAIREAERAERRRRRYAAHIRTSWKRLYPATYAHLERDGTLEQLSQAAADAALDQFAMRRAEGMSLRVCHSAAAQMWALPPAEGWELTKAVQVVIRHRCNRTRPEYDNRLDDSPGVFAVEDTLSALEAANADLDDWFDVLATALDIGTSVLKLPGERPETEVPRRFDLPTTSKATSRTPSTPTPPVKQCPPLTDEQFRESEERTLAKARQKLGTAQGASRRPSTPARRANPYPPVSRETFDEMNRKMLANARKKFRRQK